MSKSKANEMDPKRIEEEAIAWHTKVHYNKLDLDIIIRFEKWMNLSDLHRNKYETIKAFHAETEGFMEDPALVEELNAIQDDLRKPLALTLVSLRSAVTVIAAMLLVVVYISYDFGGPETYETKIAQKTTITLADGSRVLLNTDSQMEVSFTDERRIVKLNKGQGFFKVLKDKTRPFIVTFEGGKVTALGTEFDVYLDREQTQVTLLEGSVRVERLVYEKQINTDEVILSFNQNAVQVKLGKENLGSVKEIDQKLALAWQTDKLIFKNKPLGDVIYELNRYSIKKITLADSEMKSILVTGIFSTNIPETLRMLERYFDIKAIEGSGKNIILVKGQMVNINKK